MMRILSARAYDALKSAASKYGGIGYGLMYEWDEGRFVWSKPLDVWGLLECGLGYNGPRTTQKIDLSVELGREAVLEARVIMRSQNLWAPEVDRTVRAIIREKGIPNAPNDPYPRIRFEDFCQALNIQRGA